MDPNANLEEIRRILATRTEYKNRIKGLDANHLCDLIEALDGWLSRGGFPPKDWQPKR